MRSIWGITIVLSALPLVHAQPIRLASPHDGVRPHSAYVVIEGDAIPSAKVEALDGDTLVATIQADSSGWFERILRFAPGRHEIHIRTSEGEAVVHFDMGAYPEPTKPAPYEVLRTGDIILAHQRTSQQDKLYHPSYTHAALYMGAGTDGAALVFEAVSEDNATSLGPVAAVPIEKSLAWRESDRVDVFRLNGGLAREDRNRIVAWSRAQSARGLPFASTGDFGDIYRLWLMWDPQHDQPRDKGEFQRLTADLRERLLVSDAYDCATLVWHAYRDNTEAHIDLANPNRIVWGGATERESPRLAAALQQFLILPDSFALSGKLSRVTGN